jgi:predicted HicB family RNase H-like nuclease
MTNKKIDKLHSVCNLVDDPWYAWQRQKSSREAMKVKKNQEKLKKRKEKRQKREKQQEEATFLRLPQHQLSFTETKSDRVQIQFRIGEALVGKIDRAAAAEGVSRNDWIIEAVRNHLVNGSRSGTFNAVDVSAYRIPILFRVGSKVRDEIDKVVVEKNITNRTMWILDAILAALENYDFSYP